MPTPTPNKVWQKESFDHIVRSANAFERHARYIRDNPNVLPSPLREQVAAASRRFFETRDEAASTKHGERRDAAATFFDPRGHTGNVAGRLPHWRQDGVTYFVTFRLGDSIPQAQLKSWMREREEWLLAHPEPHDPTTRKEYYERFQARLEKWLDAGYGSCVLEIPESRDRVVEALAHFDGDRYRLHEFVVMPNHVHVLVTPHGAHELSAILHSWKSYTAKQILKVTAASRRLR